MHKTFTFTGLNKANDIVQAIELLGGKARLGKTWMDYGADISWETILVHNKSLDMEYQALSPRDFEDINAGDLSIDRVKEIVLKAIGIKE